MPVNNLTTSDEGLDLVRKSEGTVYHLYNDLAGNCTVATGHLVHLGRICGAASEQPFLHGCSPEQETELLKKDLKFAEQAVNSLVTRPLTQHQFDALVDFTFNLGSGTLKRSTLLKYLNAGQFEKVPAEIQRYDRAGGHVVPGLDIRRQCEIHVFKESND